MKYFYDTEEWRPVVGHPYYEVSSLGAVRSMDRTLVCADGRTRQFKGKPVRGVYDKRMGYHRVTLWDRSRPTFRTAHSLVADAFLGSRPDGQEVRHKNGISTDNRASNLEYGTRSQNNTDAIRHGTHVNARKKACNRGHELSQPNLVRAGATQPKRRACLACNRARAYCYSHPGADIDQMATAYYLKIMESAA